MLTLIAQYWLVQGKDLRVIYMRRSACFTNEICESLPSPQPKKQTKQQKQKQQQQNKPTYTHTENKTHNAVKINTGITEVLNS